MSKKYSKASFSEPSAGGVAISKSTGVAYQIWKFGKDKWECECAAYRVWHKPCKHIGLLKTAVRSNKAGTLLHFFNYGE